MLARLEAERLEQEPDIIAYRARRYRRLIKPTTDARIAKLRKTKALRIRALRHKVILEMSKGNTTTTNIAKVLNVGPSTVKSVIEERGFDKHLSTYQRGVLAAAKGHLEAKLERAALRLIEIMEDKKAPIRVQLDATKEVMDRCGLKPNETTQQVTRQYTTEEIESILRVTKEVQEITQNLVGTKSPYLIDKATKDPQKPASSG